MDDFGRLPTDIQNYIKDFYQSPHMQLTIAHKYDTFIRIQLNITYPDFTCNYLFNPLNIPSNISSVIPHTNSYKTQH